MRIWKIIKKTKSSLFWMVNTVAEVVSGKSTLKYAGIKLWSQISLVGKRFSDGVDWSSYNNHYLEELKITAKTNTLILEDADVIIDSTRIQLRRSGVRPLLVSHQLLYETIINLHPKSLLEVGCGAGDHLANLSTLIPGLESKGVDLLSKQLDSLNVRHPKNNFRLYVSDITMQDCQLPKAELVFTHAVLMHITEKHDRFINALENIFKAAQKYIVLIENWTQHDFFSAAQECIKRNPHWKIYYDISNRDEKMRVMVISKSKLQEYKPLLDYEDLTQGSKIVFH